MQKKIDSVNGAGNDEDEAETAVVNPIDAAAAELTKETGGKKEPVHSECCERERTSLFIKDRRLKDSSS